MISGSLRFLADESCDFLLVRTLRQAGYNVATVSQCAPGKDDAEVLKLANAEYRIVLTEDKDFGFLTFAA